MKNKIEIYDNINHIQIATIYMNYIPLIGTHFIICNTEYIVVDYLLADYEINTLKMIVRKATNNEEKYIHRMI